MASWVGYDEISSTDMENSNGDQLDDVLLDLSPRPYWRPEPASTHSDWRLILHRDTEEQVVTGGILVVAFAGLGNSDKPAYEFESVLKRYPQTHKLFLRDSNLQWYVPNRKWFASVIRAASAASGATKLVFFGASAGGWGALLLQALFFPEAHVAAFSPQAFLDAATRVNEEDDRWAPYVNHLNKCSCSGAVNDDESTVAGMPLNLLHDVSLAVAAPSPQRPPPRVEVHYNLNHYLDARYATYLRRLEFEPRKDCESMPTVLRVRCVPHDGPVGDEAHALAKHLRNHGVLVHILDAFLLGVVDNRRCGIGSLATTLPITKSTAESTLPHSSSATATDSGDTNVDNSMDSKYDISQEATPCAEETPLVDYEDVNGILVPRFDLDLLCAALQSRPSGDVAISTRDEPCLRPALPDAALSAARYALSEVGFFLLRPSSDESELSESGDHANFPSFSPATEQRVAECYAQCAAMAAMPLAQKQDSWSLEAARARGLLGGWRRGETDLIYCDSFRCAVEDVPVSLDSVKDRNKSKSSEKGLDSSATNTNESVPNVAPSAADVTAAAMSGRGGCLGKCHLWPEPHVLPGFRDALHGYAQALSGDAGPAVLGLLEEALCLPRDYLSSKCSPGNALSYLTTRVYPPASPGDDSAAGTLGMRMQ